MDSTANESHKLNFPETIHLLADISELTGARLEVELDLDANSLAGVVGGPPCQGFSSIGRRDLDDTRNELFVQFFRIVSELQPIFFMAENVPGIMLQDHREIRESALSFVDKQYELLPPMELSANEYGAPTTRRRVFFFGYLADHMERLSAADFEAPPRVETILVRDAFRGLPTSIDPTWQKEVESWRSVSACGDGDFADRLHGHIPPGVGDELALNRLQQHSKASGFLGTAHTAPVIERFKNTKPGTYDSISKSYRLRTDGFCPTLRAGTGPEQGSFQAVRPIHPTEPRVIAPREAARLQGFPDWFQFSPTKWHSFRQIGSSVSPILAEYILGIVALSLGISKSEEVEDG